MAIESIVIAGLFLLMAFVYFRRKRREWALAVLPLMVVPLANFVMEYAVAGLFHAPIKLFGAILVLVAAVALSAAWIGAASGGLKNKGTKITYISITNVFNVMLTAIIINHYMTVTGGNFESLIK